MCAKQGSENRIYSFEPIHDPGARLLILGTMPSEASLNQGFYYAHPRNCFWPMMAEILGEALPEAPSERAQMLVRHHIALWDVARSCEREGSLDSAIRHPLPNDLPSLLSRCPRLQAILCNGSEAHRLFRRLLPGCEGGLALMRLPSTSPAYTLSYASKRAAWQAAILTKG